MKTAALELEYLLDATVSKVWEALTKNALMEKWYFNLAEFKPEIGFEFQFYGSKDDTRYLHLCKVTEVIPEKKLSYTWKYDQFPGETTVSFMLFDIEGKTRLKLSHSGIESFGTENPDLSRASFEQGWTYILGTSLKNFIENRHEITHNL
ncbi:SRPBCC family protein [Pedobacter gandavensis]|uniref:SRPBCC domain-containing protein n=1 Tax=Pedobacter gandavensis TaxID=2679963 RepID=A0ABR6F253_9SPHI|nr:SRPBCC domain-containing protein [Pedobacter gandavensis]MBB2151608.1 SRPBCC domain-containing protein [Pedobacter gandavensis]